MVTKDVIATGWDQRHPAAAAAADDDDANRTITAPDGCVVLDILVRFSECVVVFW